MIETWSFILAFVITPAIVGLIAYIAVRLHERSGRQHPGE